MQLSFFVSSSIWTLVSISQVVESTVAIRPVKIPAEFDANITLFCDLFDELPDNVFWSKTPLNSTETINFINTNNIPIRYKIKTRPFSLNLSVSSLSIYGLTYEDEATFSCTGSTSSKINLTLKHPEKRVEMVEFRDTDIISSLCYNGNYNSVLYALLTFSNIFLIIILFCFLKFLKPRQFFDVAVAFGCLIAAVACFGIIIIFLINPSYVSADESREYWVPIIVVPLFIFILLILWIGIIYFILRSYLEKRLISTFSLIVSTLIAFGQFILCLVIINAIVYCTGSSVLPKAYLNYSVISDLCGALILMLCFVLSLYFFWIFKDQMQMIGIFSQPDEMPVKREDRFKIVPINSLSRTISPIRIRRSDPHAKIIQMSFDQKNASSKVEEKVELPCYSFSQSYIQDTTLLARPETKLDVLAERLAPVKDASPAKNYLRDRSLVNMTSDRSMKKREKSAINKIKKRRTHDVHLLRAPSNLSFISKDG